jgi:voltage-gated potassium channel Kch
MAAEPEPGRSSGGLEAAAGLVAVAALIVAAVGMWLAAPTTTPPMSVWDGAYRILQLFVLDGAATDGLTPLNTPLEIARFLAPLAAFLAVVVTVLRALRGVVGDPLRRRRIAAYRGHAIVCGNSDAAIALARNLRESGRAVVIVGSAPVEAPGGGRIPATPGDPREPATLRAAGIAGARQLYASAPGSAANAAVALAAGQLRTDPASRLSTFAQVRNDDLVEALRVRRLAAPQPAGVTMDFFAIDDIAARLMVAQHPAGGTTPVVYGFGPLGQAVLRAIVRGPGSAPQARGVVIVTVAADAVVDAEAARLDATARGWNVRRGTESDGDGPVYVCLADEDEAVATGLRLGRSGDRDVVVCLQRDSPFKEALDSAARLKIFGILDEACNAQAITDDSIVSRAARAIHQRYRDDQASRGQTVATNASMKPWPELPPHLRESNVAQAEHIHQKLKEIDAGLTVRIPATPFSFTADEVEHLAQMEHRRWMDERAGQGFTYGTRRVGKLHPDMVEWDSLTPEAQEKDRDAVRHLPDLLAAEGLYITRLPAS